MTMYTIQGPCHWVKSETAPASSVTEAMARIDQLYEAGMPFFTKQSIREVSNQLQRSSQCGDKITVRGVDGVGVEFDVLTGETRKGFESGGFEHEIQDPYIVYCARVHMTQSLLRWHGNLQEATCSLRIAHWMSRRKKDTKEPAYHYALRDSQVVRESFRTTRESWETSQMSIDLGTTVESIPKTLNIDKVLGFSCGSMSIDRNFSRSEFQHALLLTVRDWMRVRNRSSKISCYVQDPVYTSIDQSILKESGVTVLDDPQGLLKIDESSVVFSCSSNIPIKEIVADIARPAVLIWEHVGEEDEESSDEYGVSVWSCTVPPKC
ncbi:hypothetical protein BDW42DRAFT_165395 [Aspergillus taichungensis]|uniref:SRR1-like domain-containing protein n=1 Tax=Aspergillus taichungensis TaxID=482145 RepID=A0A2J5I0I1_9EURO|nr:hypothetical protein BDW42DRAFT_165395 [Aspergillus taichungensis]